MANNTKNKRCPLQNECGKKCEYEFHELDCIYYANNGIGDNTIPDQEKRRKVLEEEFEKALYEEEISESETGGIVWIDIDRLHPHPDNPRKNLGDLTELADSIRAKGILQNLTVVRGHRFSADERKALNDKYEKSPNEKLRMYINSGVSPDDYTVIIGHRRTEAARMAGLRTLPCVITEMTAAEQVQTMLLENMQRSDLTVYEQAQGFQMMFDFGDSFDDISEKTGFSKTTVRRRLKMAELDTETLKNVSARQISLLEFDKLSQIDDIDKRNEVLKEAGTANFERAVKNALDEQARKKYEVEWRAELLEHGLKEIAYSEAWSGNYSLCEKYYVQLGTVGAKDYVLTGDEEYFSFNYNTVYFRKTKKAEETQKEIEENKKREERRIIRKKLEDAAERAYELRKDFVLGMSNAEAKGKIEALIEFDIRNDWDSSALNNGYYYSQRYNKNVFEQKASEADKGYSAISEKVKANPYKLLLLHVYARFFDNENNVTFDYNEQFEENHKLNLIYEFLSKMGYEPSDEEKSLLDGTNELFIREESPDDTDEYVDEMTKEDIAAALEEKYEASDYE